MARGHRHFAARLELARRARGLSANELSLRAGFSSGYVGHYERGRSTEPTIGDVWALATALKVAPEWLAYGVGDPGFQRVGRAR
jgi:transcriptional regulator with XRE-family HTH domain